MSSGLHDPLDMASDDDLLLRSAVLALLEPFNSGAHSLLVPAHILPEILKVIQADNGISAVRKKMAGKHVVMFHVHKRNFHKRSRALGQSYFVRLKENKDICQDQVHILETRLAGLENCHVLTFTQLPTNKSVDSVIMEIQEPSNTQTGRFCKECYARSHWTEFAGLSGAATLHSKILLERRASSAPKLIPTL